VNLVNNEVSANAMQVIFKRLGNIVPGHYWIRWTIETQDGYKMFETDYVRLIFGGIFFSTNF